jgi:hypothetical protein
MTPRNLLRIRQSPAFVRLVALGTALLPLLLAACSSKGGGTGY